LNCPQGKIAYGTRRKALRAMNAMDRRSGKSGRVYVCPSCWFWHITSKARR
jgi:hypothetical protein